MRLSVPTSPHDPDIPIACAKDGEREICLEVLPVGGDSGTRYGYGTDYLKPRLKMSGFAIASLNAKSTSTVLACFPWAGFSPTGLIVLYLAHSWNTSFNLVLIFP